MNPPYGSDLIFVAKREKGKKRKAQNLKTVLGIKTEYLVVNCVVVNHVPEADLGGRDSQISSGQGLMISL